jgi:hypothetical protein
MPIADARVVIRNVFPISIDLHFRMRKKDVLHRGDSTIDRQKRIDRDVRRDLRRGL